MGRMKLIKCKTCEGMIAADAVTCPHCGTQCVNYKHKTFSLMLVIVLTSAISLFVIYYFLEMRPELLPASVKDWIGL